MTVIPDGIWLTADAVRELSGAANIQGNANLAEDRELLLSTKRRESTLSIRVGHFVSALRSKKMKFTMPGRERGGVFWVLVRLDNYYRAHRPRIEWAYPAPTVAMKASLER